jgi:hypothetical protein
MDLSCFSGTDNLLDLYNCDQQESNESAQVNLGHGLFSGGPSQLEDYLDPLSEWITYGAFDTAQNSIDTCAEAGASNLPAAEQHDVPASVENPPSSEQVSHLYSHG